MSTMDTLIRVRKFELDEKRRALRDLETVEAQHLSALEMLGDELIHEQKVASGSREGAYAYGPYGRVVIQRREALEIAIAELQPHIEKAREELADTFAELKKFELTKESRDQVEAVETNRREQALLDELGINSHRIHKQTKHRRT